MDHFVAGSGALEALAREVRDAPWVAIDTEFLRTRTFHPKLCLLQVAVPGGVYCVDPLALEIDPLLQALEGPAVKIGHALRQDLEILHQIRGRLPAPLADTQIAAMLLGYDDQTGYAALVQAELGVTLDKRHTRTDWSRRPLSEDQLHYAGNDVRHLPPLHDRLRARLVACDRLGWFEQECARLLSAAQYEDTVASAAARFSYAHRLAPEAQAALWALIRWREETARRTNRPRRWVIGDDVLVRIASLRPVRAQQLHTVRGFAPQAMRFSEGLLDALAGARADDGKGLWETPLPLTEQERVRFDALTALVQKKARALGIVASVLATRRDLEAAARGVPGALDSGWRRDALSPEIEAFTKTL
ncbi:MAG: ribonuclease D [Acidiferrobacteraceae bacterium]